MYLLKVNNNNLRTFKKKTKEKNSTKGVVQLTAGGLIGQQALRSGVPRALGVRLESHSTSRKNAKDILKNGGILDPNKSGTGAIRALENIQGTKGITDINKAKGKVYITGLHKNAKDRIVQGIRMKADEGNAVLNVLARKSQRAGYRQQAGIDWDKVTNKANKASDDILNDSTYKNAKKRIPEIEDQLPELQKKSKTIRGLDASRKLDKLNPELRGAKSLVTSTENSAKSAKSLAGGKERLKQVIKNTFLPTGKSLYIGGSDDYFDKNFLPDFDDPKAMYSTNKIKVSGNRLSATLDALKREGGGNKLKGATKLIKANKGRVGAGLAIAGLGGLAATKLVTSGVKNITGKRDTRDDKGKKRGKYK